MVIRFSSLLTVLALALAVVYPTASRADDLAKREFIHEANVMGKLGNHPNVIHFIGAVTADVAIVPSADGNNPLYEDQNAQVTNPLYESSADPGSPTGVQSISFVLDNTELPPKLHDEGIVHRDIAARNILLTTNGGSFASAPGEIFIFSNDGGARVQGQNIGPIRWMAPESLRLYPTNPTGQPDEYFDLLAGSFITVDYIPAPSAAITLALTGLGLARRRRQHTPLGCAG